MTSHATDDELRVEFEAAISKLHPSAVENIHAAMKQDKSVSWDLFRAGFAAADTLLSRRMPTRERFREVAADAFPGFEATTDDIADAIYADLFGVTD